MIAIVGIFIVVGSVLGGFVMAGGPLPVLIVISEYIVIGGTSLSGGRGTILGTVIGCLIIGVLNSGLVLLNVSPFWQQVVKGVVILVAVAIDRMRESND